jgi:hypothetical protein
MLNNIKKTDINRYDDFEKYARRQAITRFIVRYELFKQIINIKGSIIECGVHHGSGLMAWAKLSSALEPYAIHRKIVGFDTFDGFVKIDNEDKSSYENNSLKIGGFSTDYDVYEELKRLIKEYDENRYLSQFPKIELIKGDAIKTIPEFVTNNQHLVISLIFLDFDLYEPTKTALEYLLPRIPKGGIIAFDEINNKYWPGETRAVMDYIGEFNKYRVNKFSFDPNISYIVL